jgi:hypothetical protein
MKRFVEGVDRGQSTLFLTEYGHFPQVVKRQCFSQSIFTRPRPKADMSGSALRTGVRKERLLAIDLVTCNGGLSF